MESSLDKTIELFGAGKKIAIEASIMAANAAEMEEGEEFITCSKNFFSDFEIHEIFAWPLNGVKKLPEYAYKFGNGAWKILSS